MFSGTITVLFVNIAIGLIFTAGYVVLAHVIPGHRRVLAFALTYFIGTLAPLCDVLEGLFGANQIAEWGTYIFFLSGLAAMSVSLGLFYRKPVPWRSVGLVLAFGIVSQFFVKNLSHQSIVYGLGYQLPFVAACVLSIRFVFRELPRSGISSLLGAVFSSVAILLLTKPLLLPKYGAPRGHAYTSTVYALLSQSATGVLLLACGLVLIVHVSHSALTASYQDAETDGLSLLLNRRGFDKRAQRCVELVGEVHQLSVAVFDLDHFKDINDRYGHAVGDRVIAEFGALLRETLPSSAVLGRIGGEEFAVVMQAHKQGELRYYAEIVRGLCTVRCKSFLQDVTVSVGIVEEASERSLAELMRHADKCLYEAKRLGRNRVVG